MSNKVVVIPPCFCCFGGEMMHITAAKKVRGQQYLLTLDGNEQTEILVDASTFDHSGYRVDGWIDEQGLLELLALSKRNRTRSRALYYLSGRDYSAKELERKLYRIADKETAAGVVDRLTEVGLVNDAAYALRLAESLSRYRHYPKRRILQELQMKGISRENAEEAVENLQAEDVEQALALIRKKYYNRMQDKTAREKTAAALVRFGFSYDTVRRALQLAAETDIDID